MRPLAAPGGIGKTMADLSSIDTIVVVMMENRSFDHLVGYLNLPGDGRIAVDGIQDDPDWRKRYANPGPPNNFMYEATPLHELHVADPPHERSNVAIQLGNPDARHFSDERIYPERGRKFSGDAVLCALTQVPVTDFFARNFGICDRWFAPLARRYSAQSSDGDERPVIHRYQRPLHRLISRTSNWFTIGSTSTRSAGAFTIRASFRSFP